MCVCVFRMCFVCVCVCVCEFVASFCFDAQKVLYFIILM